VPPFFILLSGVSNTVVPDPNDSTPLILDSATACYWTRSRATCIRVRPSQTIPLQFPSHSTKRTVTIMYTPLVSIQLHAQPIIVSDSYSGCFTPWEKHKVPWKRRLIRPQHLPTHGSEENSPSCSCKSVASHSKETSRLIHAYNIIC
jgi:hypothetical protein